ncbi:MAG: hypothetical protein M3Q71_11510 [Chloroflexota bacterium]|nr:hypothetical protein [Chloroflexota bacterium]
MAQEHPEPVEQEEASQLESWTLDSVEEGEESDPELEAWLRQREVDLEERRFALADLTVEGW